MGRTNQTAVLDDESALAVELMEIALRLPRTRDALNDAAREIRRVATNSANEATIANAFESILYAVLKKINLRFLPEKEVTVKTRRHVKKGRMDSRVGAVILEFKRPASFKTAGDIDKAIRQTSEYAVSLSGELNSEIVGFICDGRNYVEMRCLDGDIISTGPVQQLDGDALLRLTRSIIALDRTALTTENLIRDFVGQDYAGQIYDLARKLYRILGTTTCQKTLMLKEEWETLFRLSHDDISQQRRIEERQACLSQIFAVRIESAEAEYGALFALHTAYAIILKFIAFRVASEVFLKRPLYDYKEILKSDDRALKSFCVELENGATFAHLGILNLLEGDFFSWYNTDGNWSSDLCADLRSVLTLLARYEDVRDVFGEETAIDLFKELYERVVPQVVRSSFGEFYTPHWLADHVIEDAELGDNDRSLDPCCGSGTFIISLIRRKRQKHRALGKNALLQKLLNEVCGIDLNPLAVLTARVNYFINIVDLIDPGHQGTVVIPIFSGDASYIPQTVTAGGVECVAYRLRTAKGDCDVHIPTTLTQDIPAFFKCLYDYEDAIRSDREKQANRLLIDAVDESERSEAYKQAIETQTAFLLHLHRNDWNGVWVRFIANRIATTIIGRFDTVVGNPPWIDWKNLPAGYREGIKERCIDRGLFSGAKRTGGINLNICALISYECAAAYLKDDARLAFLMPKELAYQASYEGWRRLGSSNLWFEKFIDWSDAGYPFDPVKEDFMTFVMRKGLKKTSVVPVTSFQKKRGTGAANLWDSLDTALGNLEKKALYAGQVTPDSTIFTFAERKPDLDRFKRIAGKCEYIGRVGIEFYPQELQLFRYAGAGPRPATAWFENIQVRKSKYRIGQQRVLLETRHMYPLVKGPNIKPFRHDYDGLVVPFPYIESSPHKPIDSEQLKQESPLLLAHYKKFKDVFEAQTAYSDSIRGTDPGEFYGVARTGPYSFAKYYVAYRDNTSWVACVVEPSRAPWGGTKRLVFQNHAAHICEREDNSLITLSEAHYICAIFNAPIVTKYIYASSDERSFKVRPNIYVPRFNPKSELHNALAKLSQEAHRDPEKIPEVLKKIDSAYLELCALRDRQDAAE